MSQKLGKAKMNGLKHFTKWPSKKPFFLPKNYQFQKLLPKRIFIFTHSFGALLIFMKKGGSWKEGPVHKFPRKSYNLALQDVYQKGGFHIKLEVVQIKLFHMCATLHVHTLLFFQKCQFFTNSASCLPPKMCYALLPIVHTFLPSCISLNRNFVLVILLGTKTLLAGGFPAILKWPSSQQKHTLENWSIHWKSCKTFSSADQIWRAGEIGFLPEMRNWIVMRGFRDMKESI